MSKVWTYQIIGLATLGCNGDLDFVIPYLSILFVSSFIRVSLGNSY